MKKVLFIAVLIVSGIFTSCSDSSEEVIELIENEAQLVTGGETHQDEDEDPDAE